MPRPPLSPAVPTTHLRLWKDRKSTGRALLINSTAIGSAVEIFLLNGAAGQLEASRSIVMHVCSTRTGPSAAEKPDLTDPELRCAARPARLAGLARLRVRGGMRAYLT